MTTNRIARTTSTIGALLAVAALTWALATPTASTTAAQLGHTATTTAANTSKATTTAKQAGGAVLAATGVATVETGAQFRTARAGAAGFDAYQTVRAATAGMIITAQTDR